MRKIIILGAASAILLAGCSQKQAQTTEQADKSPIVKVAVAEKQNIDITETFTGNILPETANNISSSLGGRIDKIKVEVGDFVKKGDVLVSMDQTQYLQTKTQLAQLKIDLKRMEELLTVGGVAQQAVDQLRTQVETTEESLRNISDNTFLISPVSGLVTERIYDPGDIANGKILTVMQINKVKILVNISESYLPQVKKGMKVEVKSDTYPDKSFEGNVSLVYPTVDAATRTFTTEISIPNTKMELRPGMFSRVTLNFGKAERVLVPDIAVQKQIGSNERFVFVIKDNTAIRTTVAPGRVLDKNIEIISGLNNGDQVVVAGATKLLDQTAVEIVK